MDPMGNAVHTVLEAEVPGSTVLVLGCGPIGCFAVGVARAAGASLVIASDFNPTRLDARPRRWARTSRSIPAADDVLARVRELTDGDWRGSRLRDERPPERPCAGLRRGAAGRAREPARARRAARPRWTSRRDVIFKGLTLYGVTGRKMYETWDQMRRFLRAGQFDPRPVITHRFPLESIAEAIQVIKDGQAGKVILEIGA